MPHSPNNQFETSSTFVTEEENQDKTIEETFSLTIHSFNNDNKQENKDFQLLQSQQIVGDYYRVIKPLNSDYFSKSYLVVDTRNERDSLQVLEFVGNDTSSIVIEKSFLQRVALIKKLSSHVQIPKLLSHGVENKQFYLVYEYTEGKILNSILKYRAFTESEIVNYVQDIARIYDFLIKSNIIDLDLAYYNILKSKANNRYILANFYNIFDNIQPAIPSLTTKQQQSVFQQKIHNLGIAVIKSLLGASAKNGSSVFKIPVDWRRQVSLSPQLQTILAKMIARKPSNRYKYLQQLVDDLKPLAKIQQIIGNKYRLIRYLGENSGIKTYLARNVANQKSKSHLLVVKQLTLADRDRNIDRGIVNDLTQDVKKIQQLQIFKTSDLIIDRFEDYQELYFVRNYIEGVSLGKQINQKKLSKPQEIIIVLKNILQSLEAIHQQGLIHRNLKPNNIILDKENDVVTLVDFGILQSVHIVNSNSNKNNQNRQPPEQIVGRPTISSDIYSLGIIIIEALTQLSIDNIFYPKILEQTNWRDSLTNYPFLITIIEKMICSDVDRRYQSASELIEDLEKVKETDNIPIKADLKLNRKKSNNKNIIIAAISAFCLITTLEITFPLIRPQYYVYKGKQKLPQQPKAALLNFEKALKLQEKKVAAWEGKGFALLTLKELYLALEAYEKATKINPDSMIAWRGKGNVFFQLGNLDKALENYNKSLEIEPQNYITLGKKAKIMYFLSRYQEALSLQEKAITLDSSSVWLLKDFANTSIALRKYNQALSILNRVENIEPSKPYLWQNKVTVLHSLNRSQEALDTSKLILESYNNEIEKEPNNFNLWLGKAEFLKQLKRYDRGLEAYQTAIAIYPNSHTALLGKSKILLTMKRYSEALETIEKALDLQPQSFQAWQIRGSILQQRFDLQKALTSYDRAIAINPNFFPSWRDRGIVLVSQKDYSKGIESLQKAVALAPHDLESWLYLSDTFQNTEKIEEALTAIDKAIYLQPRNTNYWLKKGSLREQQQEYTEACNVYRQAMKIAPDWKINDAMEKLGCRRS